MNYKLIEDQFPSYFELSESKVKNDEILLVLKSNRFNAFCPICGFKSSSIHSKNQRSVQDLPLINKNLYLNIVFSYFRCENMKCSKKYFPEDISDFVKPKLKRTIRLDHLISQIALYSSGESCSRLLYDKNIKVSGDTVIRILKRIDLPELDSTITHVGIDDFAFKKRKTYGTVIVDLKKDELIDIIKSRETCAVENFLLQFKNISTISRDRGKQYQALMKEKKHIADRFHLIMNLSDYIIEYIKTNLPNSILINKNNQVIQKKLLEEMVHTEYNKKEKQKEELILQVRLFCLLGNSYRKAAQYFKINRKTVKKYVEHQNVEDLVTYKKREYSYSQLSIYKEIIVNHYNLGYKISEIHKELIEIDETIKYGALRNYIKNNLKIRKKAKKNDKSVDIVRISKKSIIRHILGWVNDKKYKEQVKIINKYMKEVFSQFPELKIFKVYYEVFKESLLNHKSSIIKKLINHKYENKLLAKFTRGLQKDYDAVINSCKSVYSNGVVEGFVNKIKLIKREMYGRAGFELLRIKVILRKC